MRTIAGIPSGPLELEVSSWRRVWRTFRVENLMGGIVNLKGEKVTRLDPLDVQVGYKAKNDAKRLALDKGVIEEESELFFSGGKDDCQKFWEKTWAIDQKEREPVWLEAILLLMLWAEDNLAFLMVLERVLLEWMKEVLECWV